MEEKIKKVDSQKIESTERQLYNRKKEPQEIERHELHDYHANVPRSWNSEEQPMKKKIRKKHLLHSKGFRQIFLVAIIFFIGSVVFSLLTFFQGGTAISNNNIDIIVVGNSFVDGGEELLLQIKVANRNRTSIEIADMLIEYSKGVGGVNDIVRNRISLGEIKAGDVAEDIVSVVVFGEQGTVRDIHFTLEYRVVNSNAVFIKEYNYQVNIATSPVDVSVGGPENVISNQQFTTTIDVTQNSTEVTQNMMIIANYPSGFKFASANPEPTFGNDTWFLGDLAPGTERTIEIKGSIKASSGEERIITIVSGSQDGKDEQSIGVQFTVTPFSITVGTPFVSAQMSLGEENSNEFTIATGIETSFIVYWENELSNSLSNMELELHFSGNGFDPTRVSVNQGFFDTGKNSIIWNQTNNTTLKNIVPGQTGQLSFTITPKSGVSNPVINTAIHAEGIIVGQNIGKESVTNIYTGTIKVESTVSLGGKVLHFDGPMTNSGFVPPKVGNETTYTVEWSLSSSSSNLKDAIVKAELPSYITWKDQTFPSGEDISFNQVTREVVWKPGNVSSGNGQTFQRKAYFKIGFTPSQSHLSLSPILVAQTKLEAKDAFTNNTVVKTLSHLTSSLFNDSGYNAGNDRVVE